MKILVDTSVWSLALRKKKLTKREQAIVDEFKEIIHELRVTIIGPIRQELLSGISEEYKCFLLKEKLKPFEDLSIPQEDYETAAELSNICRRKGIQGSHTDFLICAVALNKKMSIFTTDKDFTNYKKHIDIKLHQIREEFT
ncbi:MAG: PIN domain-containing protein [Deltaproteobacteria bacterium]|nr:PIN domain-containing protein [Deltaproteobacteria bacterium]MBW2595418.1 PIN domain-containing protein [Deltaproteobacteria bacterium]MBW2649807.1 PIN domain-containing protein [Deltaproteobacteria bacterium]